jgi:uncharacterized membrane protein YcaP (DUF421 family)
MLDAKTLTDMFALGVPVLEKVLRSILVYVFLIVGLRLAGKRELAQLNPFDLLVMLTLSNAVQNAIIGDDNSVTGGIIGATALLGINWLVVRFLYRHERVDRLIEGEPDVLMANGSINEPHLEREMITRTELETAARRQGFASLDEVDRAVLESGGGITFVGKRPKPEEARHGELLRRLDALSAEVAALRRHGNPSTGNGLA